MQSHNDTIKRLAGMESKGGQKFISFYLPTSGRTLDKIKKQIKSELTSISKTNGFKESIKLVANEALNEIDQIDLQKSVAIFAIIDDKGSGSMEITTLPIKVEKKYTVASVFDLAQLAASSHLKDILLITFSQEKAVGWHLLNSKRQEKLFEIKNEDIKKWELESEYQDRYSPTRQDTAVYSTGKDKVDKLIQESARKFLKKTEEKISRDKNKFKYVIIYHTKIYNEFMEGFENKLKNIIKPEISMMVSSRIENNTELIKMATRKIKKAADKKYKKNLEEAENSPKPVVSGWKDVAEAASTMRIEKLFLKPNAKKEGYVSQNRIYATYPVKNSRKTTNLAAWITRSAINTNSDIILVDSNFPSATLRY